MFRAMEHSALIENNMLEYNEIPYADLKRAIIVQSASQKFRKITQQMDRRAQKKNR